jgi:molybdopterin molybdotransferase
VLTTGGVSVGAFDFVKEAHAELGASMDFWKVRMKPGKPLAFGRVQRGGGTIPLFGLPGNPVSCMVNFLQFVRPWIRKALGDARPWLPVVEAVAAHDFGGRSDRARLERVVLERSGGVWCARSTGSQSSGVLTSMVRAHGLLCIGVHQTPPRAGEVARVQLLDASFLDGETADYGW